MTHRQEFMQRLHARGAIAGKLAIVIALGAGAMWTAPFPSRAPKGDALDAANAPVAQRGAAVNLVPAPAEEPSPPGSGDPFAGVDVGSNPVLRHIAGIADPKRQDQSAPAQPKAALARAPTLPREAAIVETPRTPPPAAQPAPPAAAAEASTPAVVNRTSDPAPAVSAQVVPAPAVQPAAAGARATPDVAVKQAAEADQRGSAAPAQVVAPAAEPARVAMVRPDASPAQPPAVVPPRAIRRTVPIFPGEAIKAGIKTGRVLARVTIDAEGRVTESQILSARPPGYSFERESQRALTAWRYEAAGRPISTDVELLFSRE